MICGGLIRKEVFKMSVILILARTRRDGVNRARLKKLMRARGITYRNAARACGKSPSEIKAKLEGILSFTVEDVQNFYKLLNLGAPAASEIFFSKSA